MFGLLALSRLWRLIALRRARRRRLAEWTAIARTRGFEVILRESYVAIRGEVASRSFELDDNNFLGYGADVELCIRFDVEDTDSILLITAKGDRCQDGDLQPPVGDAAFDAAMQIRANSSGLRRLDGLGRRERDLFVSIPGLAVHQSRGRVLIRLPYVLDLTCLDAGCRLLESLWGARAD